MEGNAAVFGLLARQDGLVTGAVYAVYCRNLGAHRGERIAALLVAAADRADSAAERVIVGLLRAAGIAGWPVLRFTWHD